MCTSTKLSKSFARIRALLLNPIMFGQAYQMNSGSKWRTNCALASRPWEILFFSTAAAMSRHQRSEKLLKCPLFRSPIYLLRCLCSIFFYRSRSDVCPGNKMIKKGRDSALPLYISAPSSEMGLSFALLIRNIIKDPGKRESPHAKNYYHLHLCVLSLPFRSTTSLSRSSIKLGKPHDSDF